MSHFTTPQSLYFLRTNSFVDNLDLSFLDEIGIEFSNFTFDESILTLSSIIYPNPASDIVHINDSQGIKNMIIYNSLGEEVFFFKGETFIDTKHFIEGIYWVKLVNSNGDDTVKKLVITK